ncbi:transcriptional regulator [Frankia torreyi]|uniref:Transcriptional regulator n=1 Tax=Frankia torreyi TaxID=1856 RepID=A0A0D8B7E7_9ACTN|nr:GntR family transcriptional regulator [Frankia torreyi]KJE20116.1 transcriptional regulator [Frankia torreyi]
MTRYEEIAAELRARMDADPPRYPIGSRLPGYGPLTDEFGVGRGVLTEALGLLALEGRIKVTDRSGAVVLDPAEPPGRIDVGTTVRRNDLGYIFNAAAGHWRPITTPTRRWLPAPPHIARLLDVPKGADVLERHRVIGPDGRPVLIADSYLPDLARDTILEDASTGPGGIYDRLEHDLGHGPLTWTRTTSARSATPEQARELGIPRGGALLVLTRITHSGTTGRPVEVNITYVDGGRFAVEDIISRDETAHWPTTPATAENRPGQPQ